MNRFQAREARFSARTLRSYAATGLPQQLAFRAAMGDTPAEILLYDEIGCWGITAKDFVLALAKIGDGPINVRVNSPGGDTFDGMAIYNALKARAAPVTVTVDGIAASAASLIAMAADNLVMAEASMLMIHNCWGMCVGNRNDMMEMAAIQEKIDGQMAAIYSGRCGMPVKTMAGLMDAETWYTSSEAQIAGLCDAVVAPDAAKSSIAATIMVRGGIRASLRRTSAALPAYDPDGDGDNDAEVALGLINSAAVLLDEAMEALTGVDDDAEAGDGADDGMGEDMPMVPGAKARPAPRSAATEAEWIVGADVSLSIDAEAAWDAPGATARILDAAGFGGNSPDPAAAKGAFLIWDHHNPNLKGSYRLPFADLIGGKMWAIKGGIEDASAKLDGMDLSAELKARVRDVLDEYTRRFAASARAMTAQRRLRLAEAESA